MIKKETLMFIFAIKLKELRTRKGLSLKDLARNSKFSVSYLNEIEKAKKYPKPEKIALLAQALGVEYEELISTKVNPKIHPLVALYQNEFFKKLPLKEFGISETDLFDLLSFDPLKFSSFIMTIYELVRSYSIDMDSVTKAALRAFLESYNNYFEEIETLAEKFRIEMKWPQDKALALEKLEDVLVSRLNYEIDNKLMSTYDDLKETRFIFKKGTPNKLLINPRLSERQKLFVYAREIGGSLYWPEKKKSSGEELSTTDTDYTALFNDMKSSYFAGALIIPQMEIVKDMRDFFDQKTFKPEMLEALLKKYESSTQTLFNRLAQVLPKFFNLENLFFLRANHNLETDRFEITKEMHLMKLHKPHATKLSEHYCRRWQTVRLQQELQNSDRKQLLAVQKSLMLGSDDQYLAFSIARPSKLKEKTHTCITIGVLINDVAKKHIKFLDDPQIKLQQVGQTCERCEITDCQERVHPPTVYSELLQQEERKRSLSSILEQI